MWIDIVWLILAVFGIWKGWSQGLIISVFTTMAWVAGLLGAIKLCTVASQLLQEKFDVHSNYLPVISFLLVFILIALVIYLIGKSLEKIIEIAHLGFFNKITGAILRVAIYTLLFSVFLWLINESGLIPEPVKKQSRTYNYLSSVSNYAINHASDYSPAVRNIFNDLQHFF